MPSSFASPTSASVHSRTCDGPPGICVPDVSRMVWMESTASRNGWALARGLQHVCQVPARRERDRVAGDAEPAGRAPPPAHATPRPTPTRMTARRRRDGRARGAAASTCRYRAPRRGAPPRPARGRRRARDRCRRSRWRRAVRRREPRPASRARGALPDATPTRRQPGPRRSCPTGRSPGNVPPTATPAGDTPSTRGSSGPSATCGTVRAGSDIACHGPDPAPILAGRVHIAPGSTKARKEG